MEDMYVAAVEFAENILRVVALGFSQEQLERQDDLIEVTHQALQYMILIEFDYPLASLVVIALRELLSMMTRVREETERASRRGRPRIKLEEQQLCYLIERIFRVKDIAGIFSCSTRTIERRLLELGMRSCDYSSLSNAELDELVRCIVSLHPQCGEKTVTGQLRSQGYRVQRERIRESIRRIDPTGVESRARSVLHRRVYHVQSPNSLWHCDGYHKLIRWNIVVHGAIDGYSRLIMYLRASNNNRASTVLSAFTSAVEEYGLPSRIRIDRGGENVLMSQYMLEHPQRGPDRSSVISGRSVHNQRIERLLRDLYCGCICLFYNFFYFLEDIRVLDSGDVFDLYALHIVFLPVIQIQLDIFKEGWANHSLRTENNRTPLQLWILGLNSMHSQNPDSAEVSSVYEGDYGVDWAGPVPVDCECTVTLDDLPNLLSDAELTTLMEQITHSDQLTEEWMLHNFMIAKAFVRSVATANN